MLSDRGPSLVGHEAVCGVLRGIEGAKEFANTSGAGLGETGLIMKQKLN